MGKNKWHLLCTAALVIALAAAFFKISALEHEIDQVRSDLAAQQSVLRSDINAIYSNVDRQLKQQASLLSGVEVQYGRLDIQSRTVPVTVQAVPKTLTPDTQLELSLEGRSVTMTQVGNTFTGIIPVDLFCREPWVLLTVRAGDTVQTQYLQEFGVEGLWYQQLPSLYHGGFSGQSTYSDGVYSLTGSISFDFTCQGDTPAAFESFALVWEHNGRQVHRQDITRQVQEHEGYADGTFFLDGFADDRQLQLGDALTIRLEAVDSLGYVHRLLIHHWEKSEASVAEPVYGGEEILDQTGNLLYGY